MVKYSAQELFSCPEDMEIKQRGTITGNVKKQGTKYIFKDQNI
jgi:hypothetical protein